MRTSFLLTGFISFSLLAACGASDEELIEFDKGRPVEFSSGGSGGSENTGGTAGTGGSTTDTPRPSIDLTEPLAASPYPEGPYGDGLNATLPNYRFLGWNDPSAVDYDVEKMELIELADFYDPDGTKDIKLILINSSASWCPPCQAEYRHFKTEGTFKEYREKGVMFLGSLMENSAFEKPRYRDLEAWARNYSVNFPFVIDTGFKLGGLFTMDAIPNNTLVDAKTMKVIKLLPGGDTDAMLFAIDRELEKR